MANTKIPAELSSTPSISDGGNATAITIDSSENVIIGSSSALGILTIKAPSSDDQDLITISEDGTNQAFSINSNFAGSGSTNNNITLDSYWTNDIISFRGDGNIGINTDSAFSPLHISKTDWSSGAPYGTVVTIEGNNLNDANWGHLVITDTTTSTDNGGSIRFATGSTSSLNPISGIEGLAEGTSWGGLGFRTRPNGGAASERLRIDSGGVIRARSYRNVGQYCGPNGGVSVADDATLTVTDNTAGALMVAIYEAGGGSGALYFVNYQGDPQVIKQSGGFSFTDGDADGYLCIFKSGSANSHTTVFKNRTGSTRTMVISVFGGQT